jgi:hypothetical protein
LTIAPPSPASASFAVIASGGGTAYVSIGYPLRAPGGIPYTLDNGRFGEAYTVTYNSQDQQSIRLIASTSVSTLDCVPMNTDGTVKTVASNPFLIRLNNSVGTLFSAVAIDNQGSVTANYQVNGRMFRATHFETALSAGATNLDFAQYQSWSLTLGGDTQFTLANVAVGFVARVNLRSTQGRTVTWAAGSDTIYWPNSSGNLPPNSTEIGAGPLDMCLFTFFKIASGVILAQWSAY